MTESFSAQIEAAMNFNKENLLWVAKSAISDVLIGAQTTQIGITQGAESFVEGKIPVGLTAALVNSLTGTSIFDCFCGQAAPQVAQRSVVNVS